MRRGFVAGVLGALACAAWCAGGRPEIDTSPERAKTDLEPGFVRLGTLVPRGTHSATSSNWTVGCETVDRDYTDYHAYKSYLEPLGIKKIRFQAGWAKCEKEKGVYDFKWLDEIVEDAAARGIELWLEVSYGNPVYEGGGTTVLGARLPSSEEGLAAWDKWVEAVAVRYRDKVGEWEIWNEPNGRHKPEPLADFNVRTARVLKRVNPSCKIAGLASAGTPHAYFDAFLKRVQELGGLELFTWFSFHGYPRNPDDLYGGVGAMKRVLAKYPTKAVLRQGESGCPSERQEGMALKGYDWSELMQAKWDLRRMMGDLGRDIESSVFAMIDMVYAGKDARLINRKGLLHSTPDKKVEKIKLAYYAVQNAVSVFDHSLTRIADEGRVTVTCANRTACYVYRSADERQVVVLWDRSGIPSDSNATLPATVTVKGCTIKEPVWVDLISGRIYAFPAARVKREGDTVTFAEVPLYDAPVLLAEKRLVWRD
jgi:hypothetical protein